VYTGVVWLAGNTVLSALEVRFSRRCAIQIDVYLYLYLYTLLSTRTSYSRCRYRRRKRNFFFLSLELNEAYGLLTPTRYVAVWRWCTTVVVVFSCRPRLWKVDYVATTDCGDLHGNVTLSLTPTFTHLSLSAAPTSPARMLHLSRHCFISRPWKQRLVKTEDGKDDKTHLKCAKMNNNRKENQQIIIRRI